MWCSVRGRSDTTPTRLPGTPGHTLPLRLPHGQGPGVRTSGQTVTAPHREVPAHLGRGGGPSVCVLRRRCHRRWFSGLLTSTGNPVALGIVLALVLGKTIGITGATYLGSRFTHAELHDDLSSEPTCARLTTCVVCCSTPKAISVSSHWSC
ncbi:MAG: Na+/H+ antiporter NhaA [Umezawaea sp.]